MHPSVPVERAMIPNESTLPELVHEKADACACRANHPCKGFMRYPGKSAPLAMIPLPCEPQQRAGESLFAVLTKLVD